MGSLIITATSSSQLYLELNESWSEGMLGRSTFESWR